MALPPLLGVSPGDHGRTRDVIRLVEGAALGGLRVLILREPHLGEREYVTLARRLSAELTILLHGRHPHALQIARTSGWGLHLPADADATAIRPQVRGPLGQSCHSLAALGVAAAAGCDYALLSPIFPPLSKDASAPPVGLDGLRRACGEVSTPIFALGGIRPDRIAACRGAGAAGVASLGWLFSDAAQPELCKLRAEGLLAAWRAR